MTIADWMMTHPWMTFFICLAFATALANYGGTRKKGDQEGEE